MRLPWKKPLDNQVFRSEVCHCDQVMTIMFESCLYSSFTKSYSEMEFFTSGIGSKSKPCTKFFSNLLFGAPDLFSFLFSTCLMYSACKLNKISSIQWDLCIPWFCSLASKMPHRCSQWWPWNEQSFIEKELAYAFAQVLVEIPYLFVQAVVYGVIVYSMIGFERTVAKFLWYLFFMYATLLYFTFYGIIILKIEFEIYG